VQATVLVTASNALLKMVYALTLGNKSLRKVIMIGFTSVILLSIILLFAFA